MTSLLNFRITGMNFQSLKTILLLCSILISLVVLYSWNQPSIVTRRRLKQNPVAEKDSTPHQNNVLEIGSAEIIRKQPQPKSETKDMFFIQIPKSTLIPYSPPETPNISMACQFPEQDPFDPLVMEHFRRYPDIDCLGGLPSLVYLDGDYLRVNWTKANLKNIQIDTCQYVTLTLYYGTDSLVRRSHPTSFINSTQIGKKHENFVVTCYMGSNVVSKSYFTRIVKNYDKEKIYEENYKRHIIQISPLQTLSVLLVGIDGTSRQNLIRSMPHTRNFLLKNMSAIEFYRFNKVGENTFPNILPLVTGLHVDDLEKQHWNKRIKFDGFDHLFLWHDYKQAGYRTALVMDHSYVNPFHYLKRGWREPPFDYYHRPMSLQRTHEKVDTKHCVGDIPEATFLMDYWLQLTTMFNNTRTKPYFAFSFLMRITHDRPNKATAADKIYLDFFRKLVDHNVLKNTVVVFFADHGARFGPIRLTNPGMFETNTPFLFFMFPSWFHTKYPDIISTLRTNQHRLTTLFDVHATLKDLLHFDGTTGKGNLQSRGISLFKEIPTDRLCQHAGISGFFCMCSPRTTMSRSMFQELAYTLLEHINNKTAHVRESCDVLRISNIKYVFSITIDTKCQACSHFRVAISLTPGGNSIIEGVLEHETTLNTFRVVMEQRLARHGKTDDCVKDVKLRPFCYCKISKTNSEFKNLLVFGTN